KAFNTIFSSIIHTNPKYGDQKATLLICGDDKESKNTVTGLAREMGYEPIDAGPLKNARYTEAMTLLLIHLGSLMGNWDIAWKLLQR
ncbi:MAG: NADPH-dependent F420 reductase, partial [Candidatus Hodarchaeota archaeon]